MQGEAIIFIGIQATGKSTFYHRKFANTHIRINLDMLKTRHRENIILNACLEAKQSFVIDNTNPTLTERQKYIQLAKKSQFKVIGYYFHCQLEESIRRNNLRIGKQKIPIKGIKGTYSKLEIPSLSEGFEQLYSVTIKPDNLFLVESWKNEI